MSNTELITTIILHSGRDNGVESITFLYKFGFYDVVVNGLKPLKSTKYDIYVSHRILVAVFCIFEKVYYVGSVKQMSSSCIDVMPRLNKLL